VRENSVFWIIFDCPLKGFYINFMTAWTFSVLKTELRRFLPAGSTLSICAIPNLHRNYTRNSLFLYGDVWQSLLSVFSWFLFGYYSAIDMAHSLYFPADFVVWIPQHPRESSVDNSLLWHTWENRCRISSKELELNKVQSEGKSNTNKYICYLRSFVHNSKTKIMLEIRVTYWRSLEIYGTSIT